MATRLYYSSVQPLTATRGQVRLLGGLAAAPPREGTVSRRGGHKRSETLPSEWQGTWGGLSGDYWTARPGLWLLETGQRWSHGPGPGDRRVQQRPGGLRLLPTEEEMVTTRALAMQDATLVKTPGRRALARTWPGRVDRAGAPGPGVVYPRDRAGRQGCWARISPAMEPTPPALLVPGPWQL